VPRNCHLSLGASPQLVKDGLESMESTSMVRRKVVASAISETISSRALLRFTETRQVLAVLGPMGWRVYTGASCP
jgi:uncharacterized protein YaaW (UPF0174 family)